MPGSERNIVVEIPAAGPAPARRGRLGEAVAGIGDAAPAAALAVEHGEFAAEALEHDLRRIALLPRLVGPFAGLQRALDIDLAALLQELLRHLRQPLVEDHDAVPFGLLAALAAVLVAPALRGGEGEIDDLQAVLGAADFGIAAEIADENDLVHGSSHVCLPRLSGIQP